MSQPEVVRGYYLIPGVGEAECRAAAERWVQRGEASALHRHRHGESCNERCEVVKPSEQ